MKQHSRRALLLLLVTLGTAAGSLQAQQPQPSFADTILTNAEIYRGNLKNPWASAVAIKGQKIIYVGEDASSYTGPDTQVHNLNGRMLIPGIIDAHSHPGFVALSSTNLLLEDTSSKEKLMQSIRKLVADHPDPEVLIGGFWPNQLFDVTGPRKEALDAIEPNRPLILYDDWAHTVWANSAALKKAGVTRDTQDLVPGFSFFQKDENGEPSGWITESAASVFINNFQSVTPDIEKVLLDYLNYYRRMGVTTVLDAGNFGLDREVYAAVSRLDQQGLLPVRYHGAYTLFVPTDLPTAVQTLKQLGDDFNSERVRIDTLKIFFDGIMETRTAAVIDDYLDTPGNKGEQLFNQQQVTDLILQLEAEALNLHMHAVGDRAAHTLLNAVEAAQQELGGKQSIRIAICHLELVKPTDFARFKQLGVIANFTPHWASGGDLSWLEQGIGPKVYSMQRAQPLISDGAVVTFSSDITDHFEWQTERANPFLGMQVGHNRQDIGVAADGAFLPPLSERLQRKDLLNGYTTNGAYQLGRADEFGSIEVGKLADILVLDRNLFNVNRFEIHKTKPVAVFFEGELVYGELPANQVSAKSNEQISH